MGHSIGHYAYHGLFSPLQKSPKLEKHPLPCHSPFIIGKARFIYQYLSIQLPHFISELSQQRALSVKVFILVYL